MSSYIDSPRIGTGADDLEGILRDMDMRLNMVERSYVGPMRAQAVSCVKDDASKPPNPVPGDRVLVSSTGQVWTAQPNGTWALGGSIP